MLTDESNRDANLARRRRRKFLRFGVGLLAVLAAAGLVLSAVAMAQDRQWSRRNVERLAVAMLHFNNAHGRLPPAVVYGEDGKPLYSWRVLLLPHIGEEKLYQEFHLDEPWDSPHNIDLLPGMPAIYAPPPG